MALTIKPIPDSSQMQKVHTDLDEVIARAKTILDLFGGAHTRVAPDKSIRAADVLIRAVRPSTRSAGTGDAP
jgi:hypothetical protein